MVDICDLIPGCVYAEEGDANQNPFCFKENGTDLSYCLSGSKLVALIVTPDCI